MRPSALFLVGLFQPIMACAQQPAPAPPGDAGFVTVGILQGGGSLVGFDVEAVIARRFGLQIGAGLVGYGAGLNYHLAPGGRTSFISFQYWHQGIDNSHTQTVLGPNFVYRSKKWFTAQLGVGQTLEKGPAWPEDKEQPPMI